MSNVSERLDFAHLEFSNGILADPGWKLFSERSFYEPNEPDMTHESVSEAKPFFMPRDGFTRLGVAVTKSAYEVLDPVHQFSDHRTNYAPVYEYGGPTENVSGLTDGIGQLLKSGVTDFKEIGASLQAFERQRVTFARATFDIRDDLAIEPYTWVSVPLDEHLGYSYGQEPNIPTDEEVMLARMLGNYTFVRAIKRNQKGIDAATQDISDAVSENGFNRVIIDDLTVGTDGQAQESKDFMGLWIEERS